jgi:2-polyprenyl-6-methoxyphenol hydroxylase-like FAD-dependent oxidoreductase
VTLVSGETLAADALIGADGLRSAVRTDRFGPHAPRYAGYVGWRGVCPWIPPDYQGDHLSESWSEGKRFGISPMGDGRCYWYATANRPPGKLSSAGDHRNELMRLFGHWHTPVSSLIEGTPVENIIATDIHDRLAQHPWSNGAVTLLGDAAHPMTPNLGQGACFALEDACVIASCIESASDFRSAFETYERARRSRADAIQRRSYWLGKLIQLESPATTALRDLTLRLTPNRLADLSMRSLFSFKP